MSGQFRTHDFTYHSTFHQMFGPLNTYFVEGQVVCSGAQTPPTCTSPHFCLLFLQGKWTPHCQGEKGVGARILLCLFVTFRRRAPPLSDWTRLACNLGAVSSSLCCHRTTPVWTGPKTEVKRPPSWTPSTFP